MANPPCELEFSRCSAATEGNQFNFRGLYLHRIFSGGSVNQWEYARGASGTLLVQNWGIRDGATLDATSKPIAFAKGLHISGGSKVNAADFYQCFTIQFVDERFKGSTMQVMGTHIGGPDWAIVGGTGHFAMATGVINKRPHQRTPDGAINIVQLTIQGFCPLLVEGPSSSSTRAPFASTKIGPWGGSGGAAKDITGTPPKRLESITIRSGAVVDSIAFCYVDQDGEKRTAGSWGGSGGSPHTIQLSASEYVKEISGTFCVYNSYNVINSLKLTTNVKTYGPFGEGSSRGTPFNIPVQGDSAVAGFFARSGKYLDALGVYVHPLYM